MLIVWVGGSSAGSYPKQQWGTSGGGAVGGGAVGGGSYPSQTFGGNSAGAGAGAFGSRPANTGTLHCFEDFYYV